MHTAAAAAASQQKPKNAKNAQDEFLLRLLPFFCRFSVWLFVIAAYILYFSRASCPVSLRNTHFLLYIFRFFFFSHKSLATLLVELCCCCCCFFFIFISFIFFLRSMDFHIVDFCQCVFCYSWACMLCGGCFDGVSSCRGAHRFESSGNVWMRKRSEETTKTTCFWRNIYIVMQPGCELCTVQIHMNDQNIAQSSSTAANTQQKPTIGK